MDRILVVSGDFPYPPNHGGRLDIWGRIKTLKQLNYEVDLISTVDEKIEDHHYDFVNKYVKNIHLIKRNKNLKGLFSLMPFQYESRKELAKYKMPEITKYKYIILEAEYVSSILKNDQIIGEKIILRVHNNELKYLHSLAKSTKNMFEKTYYITEYLKFKNLSKLIQDNVQDLMFISSDELREYVRLNDEKNTVFLPTPFDVSEIQPRPRINNSVLFIGSLFMVNNKEAIAWYIKNIHPQINNIAGYKFIIAGNSRGESIDWLEDLVRNEENIDIYESPEDLNFLYEQCSVFVNPMQNGAGVKLKTIEAIKNGLPVVSTSIGAEGTGLKNDKNILISNEESEFAKKIISLLLNKDLNDRILNDAISYLENNYNHGNILKDFLK